MTGRGSRTASELYSDASLRREAGSKGHRYVKEWHDLAVCGRRFLSLIGVRMPQAEATSAGKRPSRPPS
jgi:hypothetical protein